MTYQEETNEISGSKFVRRLSDGAMIPTDPANSDYQQYLRWLDNPNADEFTNRTGVVTNGDN